VDSADSLGHDALVSTIKRFPLGLPPFLRARSRQILLAVVVAALTTGGTRHSDETVWTMLATNDGPGQSDAHLLEMPDGRVLLIDAGDVGSGVGRMLRARGIGRVDLLIISHPHKDHYGGLGPLLDAGIKVGELFMNEPLREVCDQERPWGCDYEDVQRTLRRFRAQGVPVNAMRPGYVPYARGDTRLEVLYAFDGRDTPIGKTDINDTSIILLLTHGPTRVLFTGDLNQRMGAYLAQNGERLEAQILKVPHHGAEGVAPNEFFDRVAPVLALAPAPPALWQSDRNRRVREHLQAMGVETLVSGLQGEVTVRLLPTGFETHVQKGKAAPQAGVGDVVATPQPAPGAHDRPASEEDRQQAP
jgi:beta-lactamase superfamily II metal-dependent hydrolase